MRTLFVVIGVLTVLCCCGGVGVLFFGYRAASQLMAEAQKYGDDSLRAIADSWDVKELERRADAQLTKQYSKAEMKSLVDKLKKLGSLRGVQSKVTNIEGMTSTEQETAFLASYTADCTFENGLGKAKLQLIKRGNEWRIRQFDLKEK